MNDIQPQRGKQLGDMTIADFTAALAAKQPVPGGGSACASILAHSAALGSMVIAYSIDKPKFAEHAHRLSNLAALLAQARAEAINLCDRDADAYSQLNALWKLPPVQRAAMPEWSQAVAQAIAAPSAIADLACGVLAALSALEGITSKQLASDLAIARRFTHAALHGALLNVAVNVPLLTSADEQARTNEYLASRRAQADHLFAAEHSSA